MFMASHDYVIESPPAGDVNLPPGRKMTEEEFVAWCDEDTRAEWVDGQVIMMSPANVDHGRLLKWLLGVVGAFVEQKGLGEVLPDVQVRLATQRTRRVPDIWFISNQRQDLLHHAHLEGPPDLIIEIVSPDSEARDWREKYLEYQAAGVREYWVIDPMSQHMEAYVLAASRSADAPTPAPSEYRRLDEKEGVIESTVLTGLRLRTAWLWPQTRPKVLTALQELGLVGSSG
jgi:Uma2 family endonuclease